MLTCRSRSKATAEGVPADSFPISSSLALLACGVGLVAFDPSRSGITETMRHSKDVMAYRRRQLRASSTCSFVQASTFHFETPIKRANSIVQTSALAKQDADSSTNEPRLDDFNATETTKSTRSDIQVINNTSEIDLETGTSSSSQSVRRRRSSFDADLSKLMQREVFASQQTPAYNKAQKISQRLASSVQSQGSYPPGGPSEASIWSCARNGLVAEVLLLLDSMSRAGLEPTVNSCYLASLCSCERGGNWELVLELLSEHRQKGFDEKRSEAYRRAIVASSQGAWQMSLQYLLLMGDRRVDAAGIDYAAAMRSCLWREVERSEAASNAMLLWEEGRALGMTESSPEMLTAAAAACEVGRLWQYALQLSVFLLRDSKMTFHAMNSLVKACSKALKWQLAVQLLRIANEGRGAGASPGENAWQILDVSTYSSAVIACQAAQRWEEATFLCKALDQLPLDMSLPRRFPKISRKRHQYAEHFREF